MLYADCGRKHDHCCDAAVKRAVEWLLTRNVNTVYIGDVTEMLETRRSAAVNTKTHAFCNHRQLVDRLDHTFGDVGISVDPVTEATTSSEFLRY